MNTNPEGGFEEVPQKDSLSKRIETLRPTIEDIDALMDFNDEAAAFSTELTSKVAELFPDEPLATKSVPAYHVLIGSGMTNTIDSVLTEEAKEFIEAEIEAFLDQLESKANS